MRAEQRRVENTTCAGPTRAVLLIGLANLCSHLTNPAWPHPQSHRRNSRCAVGACTARPTPFRHSVRISRPLEPPVPPSNVLLILHPPRPPPHPQTPFYFPTPPPRATSQREREREPLPLFPRGLGLRHRHDPWRRTRELPPRRRRCARSTRRTSSTPRSSSTSSTRRRRRPSAPPRPGSRLPSATPPLVSDYSSPIAADPPSHRGSLTSFSRVPPTHSVWFEDPRVEGRGQGHLPLRLRQRRGGGHEGEGPNRICFLP
jgi:hypothetical protein